MTTVAARDLKHWKYAYLRAFRSFLQKAVFRAKLDIANAVRAWRRDVYAWADDMELQIRRRTHVELNRRELPETRSGASVDGAEHIRFVVMPSYGFRIVGQERRPSDHRRTQKQYQ
jgi:hypothetical protein